MTTKNQLHVIWRFDIESYWNRVKTKFKRMKGVQDTMLSSYLDEFMWRERHGRTGSTALQNLCRDIALRYPVWKPWTPFILFKLHNTHKSHFNIYTHKSHLYALTSRIYISYIPYLLPFYIIFHPTSHHNTLLTIKHVQIIDISYTSF